MRTHTICLALAIVLLCPFASAQWVHTNGPYGGHISRFAVSGINLFVGAQLDTMWSRTFGDSAYSEYAVSVEQTSDGGFIILQHRAGPGRGGAATSSLIRIDTNGNKRWEKTYESFHYGKGIVETPDGGFVIGGISQGGIYVMRANANGDSIWSAKLTESDPPPQQIVIAGTADGGYILASHLSVTPSNYDLWLARMDDSNHILWTKSISTPNFDIPNSVFETVDSGFVVSGYTQRSSEFPDAFLLRIGKDGDSLWSKTYGGTGADFAWSVIEARNGGYLFAGETSVAGQSISNGWLVRTNASGDTLWTRTLGGDSWDTFYDVVEAEDGFLAVGARNNFNNVWLFKTNVDGDSTFSAILGSDSGYYSSGGCIRRLVDGGYVLSGTYRNDGYLVRFKLGLPTAVLPLAKELPREFVLSRNYPNPFNPSTTIKYELPKASQVSLSVYDILGREVSVLVNDRRDAGVHEVTFDGSGLSSGVYFYRIQAGNYIASKKMLVLR